MKYLAISLLDSILLSSCAARRQAETLKLLIEVTRHGERAPKTLFPLAKDPKNDFKIPYELTQFGAEHHYAIG